MATPVAPTAPPRPRGGPWAMLTASVAAQAAASVAINGAAFLIPSLHERGLSLTLAGTVAAMPIAGVMVTLFVWGLVVDRVGERVVLAIGLAATTVLGVVAVAVSAHTVLLAGVLFLVGTAAASTAAASGRVVIGWFPPQRRGLAMGIRQMAQPLGVALGAATMAAAAEGHGPGAALSIPVAATLVALVVVLAVVQDPPRPARTPELSANPYSTSRFLLRIHAVSLLLVVPQFLVWTFSLTWLVEERHWSAGAAGALVAVTHVLGAGGRIGVGHLSDVVGSRVRPLRWVAAAAAVTMLALGLTERWTAGVVLLVVAATVTVADNGLAFTSVAERAGAYWSGRALGLQNTTQFAMAVAVAPAAGALISTWGYAVAFGLAAVFPLTALGLTPARDERAPDG